MGTDGKHVELGWDPHEPGVRVRVRDNPGRQGTTTGKTRQAGSHLLVEIDFGPNEKQFKRCNLLERVPSDDDMLDLLGAGRFGGPADLRRILTFAKIKGDLTNVFYSMEASNTTFYPHQFKPVLKFLESPVGRLLIADEVGLGKTIEAVYIWKELQARHDARRLLVVCPAMLREKWRGDLKARFNIAADIKTAADLLDVLSDLSPGANNRSFTYIISLEALRPPRDFEVAETGDARGALNRLLYENTASDDFALLDLVIIDEAHYLRNVNTASNRLGRLLREAARHMVLLTATPIQIADDNLYQLLRLVDPDEFYDSRLFGERLRANASVVRALRCLWRRPPDWEGFAQAVHEARASVYFKGDTVLGRVGDRVQSIGSDPEQHVELARMLETRSLLGQYMVRSRKREALERRVTRSAQTIDVSFHDIEKEIYEQVTHSIRRQSVGREGAPLFALAARQRQMASSLVAALENWHDKGLLEELLWEDLGLASGLGEEPSGGAGKDGGSLEDVLQGVEWDETDGSPLASLNLKTLEAVDSKYAKLREFLLQEWARNRSEKFVVFAFFRGTLQYLHRRLDRDGIRATLIMGGMGDAKDERLKQFRRQDGPSVLLSSEVGSEGIDLQFCRFLVNYDLPWNPMRVEQRIGRLDRLGQEAERISIVSLVVNDTIEDQILSRLYQRIDLFKNSIGDLEEILGKETERLMVELLDPNLTPEERERLANEAELAVLNRRAEQNKLEDEAVNMAAFSDYILDHVKHSRERGRWLSADELVSFVEDFFRRKYRESTLEVRHGLRSAAMITLSTEAQRDLGLFVRRQKPATATRLHQSGRPVLCLFDPRQAASFDRDVELIEPAHPLIQWIRKDQESDESPLHPVAAVRLEAGRTQIPPGDYVFVTHRWSFPGLRTERLLAYQVAAVENGSMLTASSSEELVVSASRFGRRIPNAGNVIVPFQRVEPLARHCDKALCDAYEERLRDFEAENELRCNQQETSARRFAERRLTEFRNRIERFRGQGRSRLIPMTEGLIRREEAQLATKLELIRQGRGVDDQLNPLAAGVIRVEM